MATKAKKQQDQADHTSSFVDQIVSEMVPLMQRSEHLGDDLADKLKEPLTKASPEDILKALKQ
jgi:hypothetical protein